MAWTHPHVALLRPECRDEIAAAWPMLVLNPADDSQSLDGAALRALILRQHELLLNHESEIEHLKLLLVKLRRMRFGRKSEKLERQIEQLELRLEALQSEPPAEAAAGKTAPPASPIAAPAPIRRPLPDHLARRTQVYSPDVAACPDCGGKLRVLGEDVSEILEYVAARFQVVRQVRPKLSCAGCSRVVQAEAPSRPMACGLAGPGLLAHVLVAKYADHCPLYRQSEIYQREGVELERSTLAGWVAGAGELLAPFDAELRRYVTAGAKLHDLAQAHHSPAATEALDRIGALYAIKAEIRGQPPDERWRARRQRSGPLLESIRQWLGGLRSQLSRKSDTTAAVNCAFARWPALMRLLDDGRIEIDNNPAERALRAVALGRKNYLSAGSDAGAERAAATYSLIGTAKLNGLDPEAYLRELLARLPGHPINRIAELLPWNIEPRQAHPAA